MFKSFDSCKKQVHLFHNQTIYYRSASYLEIQHHDALHALRRAPLLIGAASYRFVSQSFPREILQIYTNSLDFDQNAHGRETARSSFLADLDQVTGQTEIFL